MLFLPWTSWAFTLFSTLNILGVHTVDLPWTSWVLTRCDPWSFECLRLRCYPTLNTPKFFFPKESCLLYMYTLNILIVRGFSTLNILNVPAVFLPWTSWALWGPCHPVGPYRTGEGRCRHWPGSGPYWNLSKGIKAREGHLHTKCKTGMS